jgi:hypothetical protein
MLSCLHDRTCKYSNHVKYLSHLIMLMTIYNKSTIIPRDISSMEIVRLWHLQNRGDLVGVSTRLHISSMCIQCNKHVVVNYGIKVRILVFSHQNYYSEIFYCFVNLHETIRHCRYYSFQIQCFINKRNFLFKE